MGERQIAAKSENREELVLLLLQGLERRQIGQLREYEFHQLVKNLQSNTEPMFRFIDVPISYSYELQEQLSSLDRKGYVDELMLVQNGWVPRFEYALAMIGRAEAANIREKWLTLEPSLVTGIDEMLDKFVEGYLPPVTISPH